MKGAILRVAAWGLPVVGLVVLLVMRPFGLLNQVPPVVLGATDAATQSGQGCDPRRPSFQYGYASLRQRLGTIMGEPLECEHTIHINGDTRQLTTTGYAYYRTAANVPAFASGADHWALTGSGLVYWSGDVVDPPTP